MDKHEVICLLKDAAIGLGRTPTRDEFTVTVPKSRIQKLFGTYSAMIQASGLDAVKPSKVSKPTQPKVETPLQITETIKEYSNKRIIRLPSYEKIAALGDVHFPWASEDSLTLVYAVLEREQPDVIVQVGDLKDRYSNSHFPRSLNIYTPEAEEQLAHEMAVKFWQTIRKLCPKARCFQLVGNHESRVIKSVMSKWPEGEHWVRDAIKEKMSFEGVTTIYDPTEELVIDDITVIHGYLSSLGAHRDYNQGNVICGHSHRGGVSYRPLKNKTIWELNCGLLGDPNCKALSYRAQKLHAWTLGMGIVDIYGPRFIHF